MPSPAWEDLDDFLDPEEFGVQAVITFQAGGTRTISVIFDDPYVNAKAGEYERDDNGPKAKGKETDMVGITRKDTVVIAGKTYGVLTSPQADGTGISVLELTLES